MKDYQPLTDLKKTQIQDVTIKAEDLIKRIIKHLNTSKTQSKPSLIFFPKKNLTEFLTLRLNQLINSMLVYSYYIKNNFRPSVQSSKTTYITLDDIVSPFQYRDTSIRIKFDDKAPLFKLRNLKIKLVDSYSEKVNTIRSALANIINNGVEYGKIVNVTVREFNNQIHIDVCDNGLPIIENNGKLRKEGPFFQEKNQEKTIDIENAFGEKGAAAPKWGSGGTTILKKVKKFLNGDMWYIPKPKTVRLVIDKSYLSNDEDIKPVLTEKELRDCYYMDIHDLKSLTCLIKTRYMDKTLEALVKEIEVLLNTLKPDITLKPEVKIEKNPLKITTDDEFSIDVIDNEAFIRASAITTLKQMDIKHAVYASSKAFFDNFKTSSSHANVILIDYDLGQGETGDKVALEIKEYCNNHGIDKPILIAFSANTDIQLEGYFDYIFEKPLQKKDIEEFRKLMLKLSSPVQSKEEPFKLQSAEIDNCKEEPFKQSARMDESCVEYDVTYEEEEEEASSSICCWK